MTDLEFFATVGGKVIEEQNPVDSSQPVLNFGWIPFEKRTPEQMADHNRIVGAMPRFTVRGSWRLDQRRYPLWKIAKQAVGGRFLKYIWQVTGSCVGAGGENMRKTLSALEIVKGDLEEYREAWWPYTYGLSRGLNSGQGEGSSGSSWAEMIAEYGSFDADQPDLPKFEEKQGWLQLPSAIEMKWSAGRNIAEKWKQLGRQHLVKTVARMKSGDDCVAAIAGAACCLTQASNFGFRPMVPKPQGDPPVRLVTWNGSWSHQTYVDEYWDHPTLGELFRWGNNWGPGAHGPALADEPVSSVYITKKTMDEICRTGEVYAFSAYDGFPASTIPWFI